MFLYLKCCFSEKIEQRPVDDVQKYADDTRTTSRRHITRDFFPKMEKKNIRGRQNGKKKYFGGVTLNNTYFFGLILNQKNIHTDKELPVRS